MVSLGLWAKVLSGDLGKFTSQRPRLGKGKRHKWGAGEAEVPMLKLWQEGEMDRTPIRKSKKLWLNGQEAHVRERRAHSSEGREAPCPGESIEACLSSS